MGTFQGQVEAAARSEKGAPFISSSSGSYLNQSVTTSSNGEAAYNLADGSYRVTANYLGYEYSTDPFTVPLIASQTLAIPHQAHTVSVVRNYQNDRVALANIEATLCTVDGTPLALSAATGADGSLQWSLPAQAYAVQARYLGRTYLSEPFTSGNPTVLIPEGLARVTLLQGGAALPNTQVVAISDSDPDHPQSLTSDASGVAELRLPAGSYAFKATLGDTVYQGIGTVLADQTTNVTLNLGTSTLSITVRKDETTVLPGVVCSLYTVEGEPLNQSATTDGSGVASFAVEAGTYGYDAAGNLISRTDANSQTVTQTYDALNRLVSQSYPGAARDILFGYDQPTIGRLTSIQEEESDRSFHYDSLGRLDEETSTRGSATATTRYGYDATSGELAAITYPSGRVLGFSRDATGRVSGLTLDGTPLARDIGYLPFGPMQNATLGSLSLTRTYDLRYQLSRIQVGSLD